MYIEVLRKHAIAIAGNTLSEVGQHEKAGIKMERQQSDIYQQLKQSFSSGTSQKMVW